jgi:hypothetical protein
LSLLFRGGLLQQGKLAEILGVRPWTVYSWISRGADIPHVKIEGTLRIIRKAREILSEPTSHDHGEIRFHLDLAYHIYADHSPTSEPGNHGLPMRNLSTGAQTIVPVSRKEFFSYPFKSAPFLCFNINHWIPGIQGKKRTRGQWRNDFRLRWG